MLPPGEFNVMIPELRVTLQGVAYKRIQWHVTVTPEPRITLQGAATWWIYCHDPRATCHIAVCSHVAKSLLWSCHIAGVRIPSAVLKIVLPPYLKKNYFCCCFLNPLMGTGNYSSTSNNTKLILWLLMGELLHLVQRWGDWAGPQPVQAPPRCTKCNSPPINGQCTNRRIDVGL